MNVYFKFDNTRLNFAADFCQKILLNPRNKKKNEKIYHTLF